MDFFGMVYIVPKVVHSVVNNPDALDRQRTIFRPRIAKQIRVVSSNPNHLLRQYLFL